MNRYLEKIAKTRAFKEAWRGLPGTPIPKGKLGPMGRWFNEFSLKESEKERRLVRGPIGANKKE